jgi:FkbM family methyltransferase
MGILSRLEVSTVIDVGANTGQYAQEIRALGYSGLLISFEPVPDAFAQLSLRSARLGNHLVVPAALGATEGSAQLCVTHDTTCSSLLRPESWMLSAHEGAREKQIIPIQVRTLDSFCDLVPPNAPSYLKIDTQGNEYEVLLGASKVLEGVAAIEVELSLVPLYRGQQLLPAVWALIQERGFEPYWIERGYRDRISDRLTQVDAIFIRSQLLTALGTRR